MEAFRRDPNGLAITSAVPSDLTLRVVSVNGIAPAPRAIIAGTYPLSRGVYIDINRKPGTPVAPRTAEFLRFILSPEGQAIAAREATFLPLNPSLAAQQRSKLE
jgi:phosphate transport system substrate-binding protein